MSATLRHFTWALHQVGACDGESGRCDFCEERDSIDLASDALIVELRERIKELDKESTPTGAEEE